MSLLGSEPWHEVSAKMAQNRVYKFGVFEFNLAARELRKHGVRIRLPGQPFALLEMLLESPGQIVGREEMRLRLWSTDTIVDFEHSLNSAIKKLRAALSDSPENSRYIETVPRVGYRFIAPVEMAEQEVTLYGTESTSAGRQGAAWGNEGTVGGTRLPLWIGVFAAAALALAVFAISRTFLHRPGPQSISESRIMIAVLPFENLTGDASQDYFSDGLTEEMIEQLGRVDPKHLGVIARTSIARYGQEGANLEKIKRELDVQYVLEGTVRRDTQRVRITAQLIRTKDQSQVWAREYDRTLDKLLAVQGEIAQQLSHELSLTFTLQNAQKDRETLSPESYQAYDLYLKGRYFWNKRSPEGFQRALECFRQAVGKDPKYARAYAGLADTYVLIGTYYIQAPSLVIPKAREAAKQAVKLDDTLAEGHTSLALITQNYDWDWATAEKEYRRAIELDPNYATAHHWYAEELSLMGRSGEALAEIELARKLDPMSLIISADRGVFLYYARQYDQAIEQFKAVMDMQPDFVRGRMIENVYTQKQMYPEALADSQEWEKVGEDVWLVAMRSYIYGRMNDRAKAMAELSRLRQKYGSHPAAKFLESLAYVGLNDKADAITCLERSYADHSISTSIAVEPMFDPLRKEPRFQAILEKMFFSAGSALSTAGAHK